MTFEQKLIADNTYNGLYLLSYTNKIKVIIPDCNLFNYYKLAGVNIQKQLVFECGYNLN